MISADMELLSGEPEDVIARVSETADTRRTKFDGSEIVWRIWGQGEPIVLLHGGYGSWTHWIRNVGALARAYRVIVPDMPGYGESDFPAGLKTMNDFAKVLADGLAELLPQREPYRLVGFSFGSAVASHLLPFEHARIRRLVIVGTSGLGRRTVVSGNMRRWRDLATREERHAAHRHNLNVLMIHDPAAIDTLAVHLQSQNAERTRARTANLPTSGDRKQMLARYALPLTGIWGAQDAMSRDFLDERKDALAEIDADCGFIVIPNAGHWVQYEAAPAFNESLMQILAP